MKRNSSQKTCRWRHEPKRGETHPSWGGRHRPTVLLLFTILLPLVGATEAQSNQGDCKPRFETNYQHDRIDIVVKFDLSECWRSAEFSGKAHLMRFGPQEASPSEEKRSKWTCDRKSPCKIPVGLPHPNPELADYQLDLTFPREDGGRANYGLLLPRCIAIATAYSQCGP